MRSLEDRLVGYGLEVSTTGYAVTARVNAAVVNSGWSGESTDYEFGTDEHGYFVTWRNVPPDADDSFLNVIAFSIYEMLRQFKVMA